MWHALWPYPELMMCRAPMPSAAMHNSHGSAAAAPPTVEATRACDVAMLQRRKGVHECTTPDAIFDAGAAPSALRAIAARLPMSYTPSTIGSTLNVRLAATYQDSSTAGISAGWRAAHWKALCGSGMLVTDRRSTDELRRLSGRVRIITCSMRARRSGPMNCAIASMTCALLTVSPECSVSGSANGNLHKASQQLPLNTGDWDPLVTADALSPGHACSALSNAENVQACIDDHLMFVVLGCVVSSGAPLQSPPRTVLCMAAAAARRCAVLQPVFCREPS